MNDFPGIAEWLILLGIMILAGMINGLRAYREAKTKDRLFVGGLEGLGVGFTGMVSWMVIRSVLPVLESRIGVPIQLRGLLAPGLAAIIAHYGIRQSILAFKDLWSIWQTKK